MKKLFALLLLLWLCSAFAQTFGNATLVENVDPFTDENTSRVLVPANEQSSTGDRNLLVWRCLESDEDGFEFFVGTGEYLNSEPTHVRFRFDRGQASGWFRWQVSADGSSAFSYGDVKKLFTNEALQGKTVVVAVENYDSVIYTYSFDLSGVAEALSALSCVDRAAVSQIPNVDEELVSTVKTIKNARGHILDVLNVTRTPYTQGDDSIKTEGLTVTFLVDKGDNDRPYDVPHVMLKGTNKVLAESMIEEMVQVGEFYPIEYALPDTID